MGKRSEGIKRITHIFSIFSVIGWISYAAVELEGVTNIRPEDWLIVAGGLFIAYFIPWLIMRAVYWVLDGFEKDKKSISE